MNIYYIVVFNYQMKLKVGLVNYINTYPFVEAIAPFNDSYDVIEKNPRACALEFESGKTDIALIPTGYLNQLSRAYQLIPDFGIAGDGAISTVQLFSQVELSKIKNIVLDDHSTTSCLLVKLLAKSFWNISPSYITEAISNSKKYDAALMIGDKVFEHQGRYAFNFDLGTEWKKFTGLPFVFAVWVASKEVDASAVQRFVKRVDKGLNNMPAVITKYQKLHPGLDIESYLSKYIHYRLDSNYQEGLNKFLRMASELTRVSGHPAQV